MACHISLFHFQNSILDFNSKNNVRIKLILGFYDLYDLCDVFNHNHPLPDTKKNDLKIYEQRQWQSAHNDSHDFVFREHWRSFTFHLMEWLAQCDFHTSHCRMHFFFFNYFIWIFWFWYYSLRYTRVFLIQSIFIYFSFFDVLERLSDCHIHSSDVWNDWISIGRISNS